MISGFLVNIPTSITPAMLSNFCCKFFGFFITPKSQSNIIFEFSVTNGYPLSKILSSGLPPNFSIFFQTICLANG